MNIVCAAKTKITKKFEHNESGYKTKKKCENQSQKSNSAPTITAQNCLEENTKDKLRALIPSSDVIISSELAEVLRTCRVHVGAILQMKQVKPLESVCFTRSRRKSIHRT